ncbi:MAG: serine/threonine protein kinase [Planctomycetia bacterium]|nr:serine/threonine protein kinase [Planctomycetia bacterium]
MADHTADPSTAAEARPDCQLTEDPNASTLVRGAAPAEQTLSGETLQVPGYEILGELGRGGMGVVYKARQLSLNRLVALKMIRDGVLANEGQRSRFRKEAEAIARLNHPNIVHIHDIGELNGRPYLSLEYVDAASLKEQLEGQAVPAPQAAVLVDTLARALHHMHERNLVHRDLKPGNILLASSSAAAPADRLALLATATPKIADFGLAKYIDAEGSLTPTGSPIGTASYMPPEQANGDKRIGPPADIYALGAILYELLTGRPPFAGDTWLETVQQVINQKLMPPRQLRGDIPRDLERICLKCLEKDPQQRYPTGAALSADLRAFLEGKPIDVRIAAETQAKRLDSIVGGLRPRVKAPSDMPWVETAGYQIIAPLTDVTRPLSYQARHLASDRLVLLRVLGRRPSRPNELEAWEQRLADMRQEGGVLALLRHPSVPRLVELGEWAGHHFLASDFVEGSPLHRARAERFIPPREAAGLVRTLAAALEEAHGLGIAHGDLRPDVILLDADGKAWLTNFGVVRRDQNDSNTSQTVARLRYLAPEQTASETNESTPGSNIYTLGTIFFELLAGRPPFTTAASLWKGLEQLLKTVPPSPSQFEPAVPPALDTICLKCLQKQPADRYPSMTALRHDLDQYLAAKN